jgi:hypothetical protein
MGTRANSRLTDEVKIKRKRIRDERRANNNCIICGCPANKKDDGTYFSMCDKHREGRNSSDRQREEKNRTNRICPLCKTKVVGKRKIYCDPCSEAKLATSPSTTRCHYCMGIIDNGETINHVGIYIKGIPGRREHLIDIRTHTSRFSCGNNVYNEILRFVESRWGKF